MDTTAYLERLLTLRNERIELRIRLAACRSRTRGLRRDVIAELDRGAYYVLKRRRENASPRQLEIVEVWTS
jgi:hypothetical protein